MFACLYVEERELYTARRHIGSLCTNKQPRCLLIALLAASHNLVPGVTLESRCVPVYWILFCSMVYFSLYMSCTGRIRYTSGASVMKFVDASLCQSICSFCCCDVHPAVRCQGLC